MRTAPVALAFLDDPAMLTLAAGWLSEATHHDPLAGDACVLWCHAIRQAVLAGTVPDVTDLVGELTVDRRAQWAGWIADAERRPPSAFAPNGYVVAALQAAWSAIRHPVGDGSPVVASLTAAVHAGEDTDTVAAIAGSLLGAAHGASALPGDWLEVVHGWPGMRADDLRDLARRVAERGADEAAYIGLEQHDDGSRRVWYSGDRGTPRTVVETTDWSAARERFVTETISLARSRNRRTAIPDDPDDPDDPDERHRWWQRR